MTNGGFDLHLLVRRSPAISGWPLKLLSIILESVFGYPFRLFFSKSNLETIEYATIEEEQTYYPFQPPVRTSSFTKKIDLFDIHWQTDFLKQFTLKNSNFRSISYYHEMYSSKKESPVQVIQKVKEKIDESENQNPPLRCFTQLDWNQAEKAALESTLRYEAGSPLSVLDGVPVGIKEELDVLGFRTNCGRKVPSEVINSKDGDIAAALRSLGAIIIGMTNMHEMGMGITGINPNTGTPRNPYNDGKVTGGSSSGSAAAVASGLIPFAIGTDGGGSIRIPSSFCGVCGLKPTFGLFSCVGSAIRKSTVTSAGVIANNVADVALVTCLIANHALDPRFFCPSADKVLLHGISDKTLKDITLGVYPEYVSYADPQIKKVFSRIKEKLKNVREIELEELYLSKTAHFNLLFAETVHERQIWNDQYKTLNPVTNIIYSVLTRSSLRQYMMSSAQKTRAMNMFKRVFKKVDLLISPTTACLPKDILPSDLTYGVIDEEYALWSLWFVFMANLCGLPSITLNAGYTEHGLPVGVMITGPWWSEDLVLGTARQLETQLNKPSRFYSPI